MEEIKKQLESIAKRIEELETKDVKEEEKEVEKEEEIKEEEMVLQKECPYKNTSCPYLKKLEEEYIEKEKFGTSIMSFCTFSEEELMELGWIILSIVLITIIFNRLIR